MLLCYVNTTLNLIIYFSSHNTSYLQFQKNILTHIMHCICNVKKYSCTELMLQRRVSPFFSSLLTIICFRPFFLISPLHVMLNLVNYWKNHFYHFIVWSILYFLLVFFLLLFTLYIMNFVACVTFYILCMMLPKQINKKIFEYLYYYFHLMTKEPL